MKKDKIVVAMVAPCAFPANHGTPASIAEMCSGIQHTEKAEVHVITYYLREYDSKMPFSIHRIPPIGARKKLDVGPSLSRIFYDLMMVFKVICVVRKENAEIIHAHNYEGALIGFISSIITRRPLVYHAHNTMIDELPQYESIKPKKLGVMLAKFLDFLVPRIPDHIIVISESLEKFLISKNISPAKITLIPLAVPMDFFGTSSGIADTSKYVLPSRPRIIYTGTLDRFQRLDYLFLAFEKVLKLQPSASLLIVANQYKEEQLNYLKRLATEKGIINSVFFYLTPPLEMLPFFLYSSDVAVVPRPGCPGFPVKIFNYMAAGKAIVAFEGSGKGLIHEKSALLAEDHNVEMLGEYIAKVIGDPNLKRRLGEGAKKALRRFDPTCAATRILQVYEKVLQ